MDLKDTFLDVKLANRYKKEVLIGNWFERRAADEDNICKPSYKSEYKVQYLPKRCDCLNTNLERKHNDKENGRKIKGCLIDSDEFIENMTTTTDLVYKHLVKDVCGPLLRKYRTGTGKYEPQPDLMTSYGNLTHFGLNNWYKCLKNKEQCTSIYTLYKDSYRCPEYSALSKFTDRRATPKHYSSKTLKANLKLANFKPRNKQILTVPDVEIVCVNY